jgi:hypothetical protein
MLSNPPELLPAPVPEPVIDAVFDEIRQLHRGASVELWLRIGELILRNFYEGDLEQWRERGPKDSSFRSLAAKFEDGDISATRLSRMVGVYALGQRFGVAALQQLSTSHLVAVLGLEEEDQRRLIAQATLEGLSTRQLQEAATALRDKQRGGGRRPLPAFVKSIRKMGRMLQEEESSFAGLDQVEALDQAEAKRLYEALVAMKARCETLQLALHKKAAVG